MGGRCGGGAYVILSLICDHLTVVSQRRQTGSRLDVNDYKVVPMAAPAFDVLAAQVIDATIAKAHPDAARHQGKRTGLSGRLRELPLVLVNLDSNAIEAHQRFILGRSRGGAGARPYAVECAE